MESSSLELCIMAPSMYQAVMDFHWHEEHNLLEMTPLTETLIVVFDGPLASPGQTVDRYGREMQRRYSTAWKKTIQQSPSDVSRVGDHLQGNRVRDCLECGCILVRPTARAGGDS
jgi:hypothetical protein